MPSPWSAHFAFTDLTLLSLLSAPAHYSIRTGTMLQLSYDAADNCSHGNGHPSPPTGRWQDPPIRNPIPTHSHSQPTLIPGMMFCSLRQSVIFLPELVLWKRVSSNMIAPLMYLPRPGVVHSSSR